MVTTSWFHVFYFFYKQVPATGNEQTSSYDARTDTEASSMPRETATPAQLEARLQAGEWLRSGQVAKIFNVSRWTVLYWLKTGVLVDGERFYIRFRESPGGWRTCHPDDVQRVLTAHRTEHIAQPEEHDEPGTEGP